MPKPINEVEFHSIGGAQTHIVLEMTREAGNTPYILLGSALTLSYSVYRDKTPVFNCGSSLVDGFSIGNKYVAGSLISMMNSVDEFASFMQSIGSDTYQSPYSSVVPVKEVHTFMRDDLVPFNIHAIFSTEYTSVVKRIIIYDATFINNGQVMSINDLITENTMSFVGRDIQEQHNINDVRGSVAAISSHNRASSLLDL